MLLGYAACVMNECSVSSCLFELPTGNEATHGVATGEGDYQTGNVAAGAVLQVR